MTKVRLACASVLTLALLATATAAGADTATSSATDWLAANQQPDGGFELASFPPFETPDAVLAIAEDAQTTATWSTSEALAAVEAVDVNGGGPGGTALDWADAWLTEQGDDLSAGRAAKFIVNVAAPLGLSTTAFDPAGDGDPIDLEALMDAGLLPDGSYGAGALNATLTVLTATAVLGRPAPEDTIAYVRSVQQANGGFNFAGDPSGTEVDPDTTASAVAALAANGVPAGDATIADAMRLLANAHQATGAWQAFGADDPNSTAVAMIGIAAAGWDPETACWKTSSSSATSASGFVSGDTWLRSQQLTTGDDAGRFASPNDGFGVNSSATSQAVQGLLRSWLPFAPAQLQAASGFADDDGCSWYSQALGWGDEHSIAPDTTNFRPKQGIANRKMVLFLWNTMDQPAAASEHGFTDVPANASYGDALDWAAENGIVFDVQNGTFRPGRILNRIRIAVALWTMVGEPTGSPSSGLPDVPSGAWYEAAADWTVANGVISPVNGNFAGKRQVSRGQLMNMLYRVASTEPAWDTTPPSTVTFG